MAGGVAVGTIILIWLVSRKSSASAAQSSAGAVNQGIGGTGLSESGYLTLQEASLQASQNIQAVQLQANVQTSAQETALQEAQANYANQLAIAQLQAQVSLQQIQSNASTSDTATQAALQASLAQTGAGVQTAHISADEAVTIAGLQTQVQLAQIAATNNANNVILQLAGVIAGVPANPQPTATQTTPVVVPSVPTIQTTRGSTTPIVTSQPGATVPAGSVASLNVPSGALIPYDQLTNDEWYQLISLETNQPLSQVQNLYSQVQPGSTITNLQQTVGAHSTAQSAYSMYASGAIVNDPHGAYQFAYGGPYQAWALSGAPVNTWAVPQPVPHTGVAVT